MSSSKFTVSAVTAPNQFVETNGRRLAYRSIGSGKPIVLCTRFRGNMDVWDPAFLESDGGKLWTYVREVATEDHRFS